MTERWCDIVLGTVVTFSLIKWLIGQQLTVSNIAIISILFMESFILWQYEQKNKFTVVRQSLYRPNASSGALGVLLVPVTVLAGESHARKQMEDTVNLQGEIWLSVAVTFIIVLRLTLSEISKWHVLVIMLLSIFGDILHVGYDWMTVTVMMTLVTSWILWKCLELFPVYLQKSFTFGELSVVLQLFLGWIIRMSLSGFQKQALTEEDRQLAWFVCTLVLAVIIATLIVIATSAYSSLWYFLTVYIMAAVASLLILQIALHENPLLWFFSFIFGTCTKIFLLATWVILLAVTVVWTVNQALQHLNTENDISHQQQPERSNSNKHLTNDSGHKDQSSSTSSSNGSTLSFTIRKVFHVFIVLVYIPGLILDSRFLLLASTATFGLLIILEAARALNVPVIGEHLDKILRTYIDDRDQGPVFLTHIYLLVGLSLPLWISHSLFSSHTSPFELYSGVLSLGVGDTIACIAGRAWGKIYWPGSRKTLEGTLCSITSQIALITVGSYLGVVSVSSFMNAFIGVCLSSLFEAFTDQIDNLLLPLVIYPFLCFSQYS